MTWPTGATTTAAAPATSATEAESAFVVEAHDEVPGPAQHASELDYETVLAEHFRNSRDAVEARVESVVDAGIRMGVSGGSFPCAPRPEAELARGKQLSNDHAGPTAVSDRPSISWLSGFLGLDSASPPPSWHRRRPPP